MFVLSYKAHNHVVGATSNYAHNFDHDCMNLIGFSST